MSARGAASATASEIARPSDPGLVGSATGDGTTDAPHVSMRIRRYGFCSYDARTMYTLHSMSNCAARERDRAPPLARAGLGREALDALGGVVERLRHGGVRLVRPGRRDRLVLVIDARRCAERALEPLGPDERRRPPQAQDVDHLAGDLDPRLGRHLLRDEPHREQRREVVGADRFVRRRVQRRLERRREVGQRVVPGGRELRLRQIEAGHGYLLSAARHGGRDQ